MDTLLLLVFQQQVADQCRVVRAAVPMINQAVRVGDHDNLWIGCQLFLVGAGNLAKVLWGQRGKLSEQRRPLRESLGVGDDSPLADVDMRNNFEHFDERLDRWWRDSPRHAYLDQHLGPPEAIGGLTDLEMFRIYDPTTGSIVFWGDRFQLQPILSEVDRIFPIARAATELG